MKIHRRKTIISLALAAVFLISAAVFGVNKITSIKDTSALNSADFGGGGGYSGGGGASEINVGGNGSTRPSGYNMFTDDNFYSCVVEEFLEDVVAAQYGKNTGAYLQIKQEIQTNGMTAYGLSQITTLNCSNRNITDTTGLSYMTSLNSLNLSGNPITLIKGPVSSIRYLYLQNTSLGKNNGYGTIDISYYPRLTRLDLTGSSYVSYLSIGSNTQLQSLLIKGTSISSINIPAGFSCGLSITADSGVNIKDNRSCSVSSNKLDQTVSFAMGNQTKTYGDAKFINKATTTGNGAITYKSSKESVATVSSTGEVTIKGVGTTTIRATAAATSSYNSAYAEYTLTVKPATQTVSFASGNQTKTYGDAKFTNKATTTGNGAITYSSSNTSIATVNSSTGEVTIKGAGSATITATAAATTNYNKAAKTYNLTVKKADQTISFSGVPSDAFVRKTYGDDPFTYTATASGGGTVTYEAVNPEGTTVAIVDDNGRVTIKNAGIASIKAKTNGDSNYNGSDSWYRLFVYSKVSLIERVSGLNKNTQSIGVPKNVTYSLEKDSIKFKDSNGNDKGSLNITQSGRLIGYELNGAYYDVGYNGPVSSNEMTFYLDFVPGDLTVSTGDSRRYSNPDVTTMLVQPATLNVHYNIPYRIIGNRIELGIRSDNAEIITAELGYETETQVCSFSEWWNDNWTEYYDEDNSKHLPLNGNVTKDTKFNANYTCVDKNPSNESSYIVSAVTHSPYGSVSLDSSITVPTGTPYVVSENRIEVGEGNDKVVITAETNGAEDDNYFEHTFDCWHMNGQDISPCIDDGSYIVSKNISFLAAFKSKRKIYSVSAIVNNDEWGTVTDPVSVPAGTKFTISGDMVVLSNGSIITATPQDGYRFTGWKESRYLLPDDYTDEVTGDVELRAYFVVGAMPHEVSAVVDDESHGSIDNGSIVVPHDTPFTIIGNKIIFWDYKNITNIRLATITVEPNENYEFSHWNYGSEELTDHSSGSVTDDTIFTAMFNEGPYVVSAYVSSGEGSIDVESEFLSVDDDDVELKKLSVPAGTRFTISNNEITFSDENDETIGAMTAVADEGYEFSGWDSGSEELNGTITGDVDFAVLFDDDGTSLGEDPGFNDDGDEALVDDPAVPNTDGAKAGEENSNTKTGGTKDSLGSPDTGFFTSKDGNFKIGDVLLVLTLVTSGASVAFVVVSRAIKRSKIRRF